MSADSPMYLSTFEVPGQIQLHRYSGAGGRLRRAWAGGGCGFEGVGTQAPGRVEQYMGPAVKKHGTRYGYAHGCPCEECVAAGQAYERNRKRRARSTKPAAGDGERRLIQ